MRKQKQQCWDRDESFLEVLYLAQNQKRQIYKYTEHLFIFYCKERAKKTFQGTHEIDEQSRNVTMSPQIVDANKHSHNGKKTVRAICRKHWLLPWSCQFKPYYALSSLMVRGGRWVEKIERMVQNEETLVPFSEGNERISRDIQTSGEYQVLRTRCWLILPFVHT